MAENHFILAGNGPYDNRGCEAIVRGTTEIIRHYFEEPKFSVISNFQNDEQFKKQLDSEYDHAVTHKKTQLAVRRVSAQWVFYAALRLFAPVIQANLCYRDMLPELREAQAVLSVGGDNYSLDYGKPWLFTMLDELVLIYKRPIIIWGASIGPFDALPGYEKYMIGHLKKITRIFVRETTSYEYLVSKGVKENVVLTADPAFLLEPVPPRVALFIEDGALGINLSPLMAKYLTDGNYSQWVKLAAKIIRQIFLATKRKIYLLPHVTSPHTDDHAFLKDVFSLLDKAEVTLIGNQYNAAETKWIISKFAAFVGARTHSTIAAFSTYVPTLSLAYSIKARGINRDVFGDEDFCILKDDCQPFLIAEKVEHLLSKRMFIHEKLKNVVPMLQRRALFAGEKLKVAFD